MEQEINSLKIKNSTVSILSLLLIALNSHQRTFLREIKALIRNLKSLRSKFSKQVRPVNSNRLTSKQ